MIALRRRAGILALVATASALACGPRPKGDLLAAREESPGEDDFRPCPTGWLEPAPETKPAAASPAPPLFTSHQPISMVFAAGFPMSKAVTNLPGSVSYALPGEPARTINACFETRGNNKRLTKCGFRPFKLHVGKQAARGSPFEGMGKSAKFATHCYSSDQKDLARANDEVVIEYLLYRTLNALPIASHRIRLVDALYVSPVGDPIVTAKGFFVEPAGELAERVGYDKDPVEDSQPFAGLPARARAEVELVERLVTNNNGGIAEGNLNAYRVKGAFVTYVPFDFDANGFNATADTDSHATWRDYIESDETALRDVLARLGEPARQAMRAILSREASAMAALDEVPTLSSTHSAMTERFRRFFDTARRVLGD